MPDGSSFWGQSVPPVLKQVKPVLPPAVAEAVHREGRHVGYVAAVAAELGTVAACVLFLTASPWVPLAFSAALYGAGLSRASQDRNFRTTTIEPVGDWGYYPDLIRTYGSPRHADHTPENFRPYKPNKKLWQYSFGGFWDGFTNRGICSYVVQTAESVLYNLGQNNKPRDRFKPRRLSQARPEWHRHLRS